MSRQQNRVLQAMISLRTFTARDLEQLSGVTPATIRTVIKRFQSDLELVGQQQTGRRGGQLAKYIVRHDSVGRLVDHILDFVPVDFSEVEDERSRLLWLTTAYDALVGDFASLKSAVEQRQLLEDVAPDRSEE